MIILKRLFLVLFLTIASSGCAELFMIDRVKISADPSPFDDPIFANYETYQAALEELDDIDPMSDSELENLLFTDNYEIYPEFLPHIDHYEQLKEEFIGDSMIRSNIRFVMTNLENIATEADFIKFKNNRSIKGISGQCRRYILNSRKPLRLIEIDYTFWILNTPSLKNKHTIFHELGHCDLDRGHEPNNASSLMVEERNQLPEYLTIQELYKELFDPEKINSHSDRNVSRFREYEQYYFSNNE